MADPLTVDVIIAWRPTGPDRDAALAWTVARYHQAHPDWTVIIGHQPGPPSAPWCKAEAVAAGIAAGTGDLLVIADADVWCDNLLDATAILQESPGPRWAVPHLMVRRLNAAATAAVLAGGELGGRLAERPHLGHPGGGLVVLARSTYQQVPLDPRFTGWGQEDDSWATALGCLAGAPWRGTSPLWHLWHPPAARQNRVKGSQAGWELHQRYRRARRDLAAMAALLDEARSEVPA